MSRTPRFQRPLFENSAKITFRCDASCSVLRIVTRHSNGKHSFYLNRNRFLEWLDHGSNQYLEMDCSNLLRANQYHGIVSLHFYWMSEGYGGQLQGYTQSMDIPCEKLKELLTDTNGGVFFTHQNKYSGRMRFDFTGAERTMHAVCSNPLKRRALSKALRNRIGSRYDEVIHAYNDFSDSFYLIHTMAGGREYNGGLILHQCEKDGRTSLNYSFHT